MCRLSVGLLLTSAGGEHGEERTLQKQKEHTCSEPDVPQYIALRHYVLKCVYACTSEQEALTNASRINS
jgi:hypothetical protein